MKQPRKQSGHATRVQCLFLCAQGPHDAVIGSAAQQAASRDPLNTFSSVKRLIGRTFANCYREAGSLVYKLVEGPQGETLLWSPAKYAMHSLAHNQAHDHIQRCRGNLSLW